MTGRLGTMPPGAPLMPRLLTGEELGHGIRHLLQATGVRCAVAFWGAGATDCLFGGRLPEDARIICNLDMGGTNPSELMMLGAPDDIRIRHIPGLHAKLYLSDAGVLIGSANASANGIGFQGPAALVEAGTMHDQSSSLYRTSGEWFDRLWETAEIVDRKALQFAETAWSRRSFQQKSIESKWDPTSLFASVAADPRRFRGVGFVFTTGQATEEDRDEAVAAVIAADDAASDALLSRSDRRAIRSWRPGDVFVQWDSQDIHAWPERFISAHRGPRGRFSFWFYERVHTTHFGNGRGAVLGRRPGNLRHELGFRHGAETMAARDAPTAALIFEHLNPGGHGMFENPERLLAVLAEVANHS